MMRLSLLLQESTAPDMSMDALLSLLLSGGSAVLPVGLLVGLGLFFASRHKVCPTNRLLVKRRDAAHERDG